MGFATTPRKKVWHTPVGAPEGCRFQLRHLTEAEKAELVGDHSDMVRMIDEGVQDIRVGTLCVKALKKALVGWDGFEGDEGEIPFVESKKLDRIPHNAILEMGLVAVGMARVNDGDLGNSESASPLSPGASPTVEPAR